uniref:Uncharacterized protein n=1 Tax=Chrysotila carterae TaxID=13221 RepID=A0A7S4BMI6_CHRCT
MAPQMQTFPNITVVTQAGLEHTGHHLWDLVLKKTVPFAAKAGPYFVKQTLTRSKVDVPTLARALREDYENTSPKNRSRPIYINICSYPCDVIGDPDIGPLAQATVLARMELKVMVMTRPPEELLYRYTMRRLKELLRSCETMERQLLALRAFRHVRFMSIEYKETVSRAPALSDFLGFDVRGVLNESYHTSKRSQGALQRVVRANLTRAAEWHALLRCNHRVHR